MSTTPNNSFDFETALRMMSEDSGKTVEPMTPENQEPGVSTWTFFLNPEETPVAPVIPDTSNIPDEPTNPVTEMPVEEPVMEIPSTQIPAQELEITEPVVPEVTQPISVIEEPIVIPEIPVVSVPSEESPSFHVSETGTPPTQVVEPAIETTEPVVKTEEPAFGGFELKFDMTPISNSAMEAPVLKDQETTTEPPVAEEPVATDVIQPIPIVEEPVIQNVPEIIPEPQKIEEFHSDSFSLPGHDSTQPTVEPVAIIPEFTVIKHNEPAPDASVSPMDFLITSDEPAAPVDFTVLTSVTPMSETPKKFDFMVPSAEGKAVSEGDSVLEIDVPTPEPIPEPVKKPVPEIKETPVTEEIPMNVAQTQERYSQEEPKPYVKYLKFAILPVVAVIFFAGYYFGKNTQPELPSSEIKQTTETKEVIRTEKTTEWILGPKTQLTIADNGKDTETDYASLQKVLPTIKAQIPDYKFTIKSIDGLPLTTPMTVSITDLEKAVISKKTTQ